MVQYPWAGDVFTFTYTPRAPNRRLRGPIASSQLQCFSVPCGGLERWFSFNGNAMCLPLRILQGRQIGGCAGRSLAPSCSAFLCRAGGSNVGSVSMSMRCVYRWVYYNGIR